MTDISPQAPALEVIQVDEGVVIGRRYVGDPDAQWAAYALLERALREAVGGPPPADWRSYITSEARGDGLHLRVSMRAIKHTHLLHVRHYSEDFGVETCRTPGCDHRRFLEPEHVTSQEHGPLV